MLNWRVFGDMSWQPDDDVLGIERQNIDTKNVAQTAMPDGPTPHRWGATTCGSLAYRGPEILGEIPRYNEAVNWVRA